MQFFTHTPKPPLGNFVELFWFYDGYSPGPHSKERLMPDGSIELVINLKQDEARIYDRENLTDTHGFRVRCSAAHIPASL